MRRPPQPIQILGSVAVALLIAAIAVAVVTAHFGPTSAAKLEAREDIVKERVKAREEQAEEREEARERRLEEATGRNGGGSG